MRILTPRFYAAPDAVQTRVAFPMGLFLDEPIIGTPTAAGFRPPFSKKLSHHGRFPTAGTSATPHRTRAFVASALDYGQSTKCLTNDIGGFGHGDL